MMSHQNLFWDICRPCPPRELYLEGVSTECFEFRRFEKETEPLEGVVVGDSVSSPSSASDKSRDLLRDWGLRMGLKFIDSLFWQTVFGAENLEFWSVEREAVDRTAARSKIDDLRSRISRLRLLRRKLSQASFIRASSSCEIFININFKIARR